MTWILSYLFCHTNNVPKNQKLEEKKKTLRTTPRSEIVRDKYWAISQKAWVLKSHFTDFFTPPLYQTYYALISIPHGLGYRHFYKFSPVFRFVLHTVSVNVLGFNQYNDCFMEWDTMQHAVKWSHNWVPHERETKELKLNCTKSPKRSAIGTDELKRSQ